MDEILSRGGGCPRGQSHCHVLELSSLGDARVFTEIGDRLEGQGSQGLGEEPRGVWPEVPVGCPRELVGKH